MSHIESLIKSFSVSSLQTFFRQNISSFKADNDDFDYLFKDEIFDKYESITKIGEATIENDEVVFIASKTNDPLTERSGKKKQYEIAKTILKHENVDAALFVFYDANDNFRFSFVKANYLGSKRDYTDFKRYSYFVAPKLTNKTFIKQVGNCTFNSIDEIIKSFSVEPLNKDFYQEIAKAFYGLIGGKIKINTKEINHQRILKLPSVDANDGKKFQEFAVRLIGRTIFCWFLKNKKSGAGKALIPEEWLSSEKVIQCGSDNYYHTILEKLFFLILNKKVEDRKPYSLPKGHEDVPFLNGGLFEAQEDDFFPKNSKGIHQFLANLVIPNEWFENLFKVLEQYNFTIDENSINDSEVSIDPEMLGTIFENLLAEIDPDTEKSARKSTGSFYTPREIVDYMVEQSLLNYLKNKTRIEDEEQLQSLFKEGTENPFDDKHTKAILQALSDVKILDPACGSGAFPMGALHKIIMVLQKLDKGAIWWKENLISQVKGNSLAKKLLKEKLDNSPSDYIRKLGVIQNSIYGVDIQPIASEISKLRSFLSLVIDENIDDKHPDGNRGILPLPNLEFKFVTANTLIGLSEGNKWKAIEFDFGDTSTTIDELQDIRDNYLQASGEEKEILKKQFLNKQNEIAKKEFGNSVTNTKTQQIISWQPFSNKGSDWFDPKWMFGVEKFDIIIGNPPYGVSVKGDYRKKVLNNLSKVPDFEIYYFFIEIAKKFLKDGGIKTYIIPNTFLFNVFASDYRKKLIDNWSLNIIDCTAFKIFEGATVHNAITIFNNIKDSNLIKYKITANADSFQKLILNPEVSISKDDLLFNNQNWGLVFKLPKEKLELIIKIKKNSQNLYNLFPDYSQGLIAYDSYQGQSKETIKNRIYHYDNFAKKELKKWLWGSDVTRYDVTWNGKEWVDYCEGIANPRKPHFFNNQRILIREITNPRIFCALTDEELYFDPSIITILKSDSLDLKVLLALLNSQLITFFHFNSSPKASKGAFPKILVDDVKNFPLPINISDKVKNKLIELVDKMNIDKKDDESDRIIDVIIYKLYNIDYNEVLLIEPNFKMNQSEYDNYKID